MQMQKRLQELQTQPAILQSWSKLGSGQYRFVAMVGKISELSFPTNGVRPPSPLAINIISQE